MGESPTLPLRLLTIPPVEVAAARFSLDRARREYCDDTQDLSAAVIGGEHLHRIPLGTGSTDPDALAARDDIAGATRSTDAGFVGETQFDANQSNLSGVLHGEQVVATVSPDLPIGNLETTRIFGYIPRGSLREVTDDNLVVGDRRNLNEVIS